MFQHQSICILSSFSTLINCHISLFFFILTIESLNMAVKTICHNMPWKLIPSHSCSQKSHFLLELLQTLQTGKRPQLKLKLLLQDVVSFVSRTPLIAKLGEDSEGDDRHRTDRYRNNERSG